MPARDGSGPVGLGSKTGWGLGDCDPINGSGVGPEPLKRIYCLTGALGVCGMILGRFLGRRGMPRLNRNRRISNRRR